MKKMKKLMIAVLLLIGISAFAQNRKEMGNRPDRPEMEKFTPEQRNLLMLKKITLELDLNEKQQEQVKQIIAEQSAKREATKAERIARKQNNEKPSPDEIFEMKIKMLDDQIEMQNKMKAILSQEQFRDWKNMKGKFQERNQERRHEKRGPN